MIQELRTLLLNGRLNGDNNAHLDEEGVKISDKLLLPSDISFSVPLDAQEKDIMDIIVAPGGSDLDYVFYKANTMATLCYSIPDVKIIAVELFDSRIYINKDTSKSRIDIDSLFESLWGVQGLIDFVHLHCSGYGRIMDLFNGRDTTKRVCACVIALAISVRKKIYG